MKRDKADRLINEAMTKVEMANDMETVADALQEDLPPGQLKNLRGKSERLTTVLLKYGVKL